MFWGAPIQSTHSKRGIWSLFRESAPPSESAPRLPPRKSFSARHAARWFASEGPKIKGYQDTPAPVASEVFRGLGSWAVPKNVWSLWSF